MDYKKNVRYFENKKLLMYGGAAVLAIGLILFFGQFGDRDSHYIIFVFSVICMIAGGFTFGISVTLRSNDKRIDEDVAAAYSRFEEEKLEKFDLYERQLPYIRSVELNDYKYYEGSYIRRDRMGHYRTDVYVRTHIYFTPEALYIASKEVSLVCGDRIDRDAELPYTDILKAELRDHTVNYTLGKKQISVTVPYLYIIRKNGEEIFYQVRSDLEVDTAVEDINRLIEKAAEN